MIEIPEDDMRVTENVTVTDIVIKRKRRRKIKTKIGKIDTIGMKKEGIMINMKKNIRKERKTRKRIKKTKGERKMKGRIKMIGKKKMTEKKKMIEKKKMRKKTETETKIRCVFFIVKLIRNFNT